jgi:hypothetical protein
MHIRELDFLTTHDPLLLLFLRTWPKMSCLSLLSLYYIRTPQPVVRNRCVQQKLLIKR